MDNNYDILLIAPRYGIFGEYYSFPIGLACVSSSLQFAGFKVKCLNLNHYEDEDKIIDEIMSTNDIKIVATGGLSAHINSIQKLRNKFKKYLNIKFILGGGLLSSEPKLIFEELDIDYGVLHEGEETIVELADYILNNKIDVENINGIVYKENNQVKFSTARDSIKDLDSLPYPDYDGFEVDKYLDNQLPNDDYQISIYDKPRVLPVITTRSCPFSCTFCYHPLGKKYRVSSLDYFFKWLDYLVSKYKVNILYLLDELFSVNKKRMLEFAERIKPYNLKWACAVRVTDVDDEILSVLKDAGLYSISYGLESANEAVLKSMKKKIKMPDVEKALTLTKKYNIGMQANFIFGDTAETEETYKETLNWWKNHQEYQIMLSQISAYPGTPIYMDVCAAGKIKNKIQFIKDGSPQINLTTMSDEKYIEMRQNIIDAIYENKLYPEVLSSKIMGHDKYRGNLYEISLVCPHCKEESTYKNMHKVENFVTKTCCRKCNQKFDVNIEEFYTDVMFEDIYFLNSKRALSVSKQNNMIDNEIQYCYYEGSPLEDAPANCINVPYDNFVTFFEENDLRVPTKIEFGLATLVKDRRTVEKEFQNMKDILKDKRLNAVS